jgi:hypothetical protein
MRSMAGALLRALASLVLVTGLAAPARADLVPLAPSKEIFSGPGTLFSAQVAFDEVNQVYLVVWGTMNPQPALGIVLNTAGHPITPVFVISDGPARAGWVRVAAGGGRFLVTYNKVVSGGDRNPISHQLARFVSYSASTGVQFPSGEIFVDNLGGFNSDAGVVYVPAQNAFLTTWWKNPAGLPQSYVRRVNADGTVGAVHQLTDNSDGLSDPEIACDNAGACLAVGFAWDSANGTKGATWSRLIDAASGAPTAPMRYLDVANRQESQAVTFSAAANRYVVAWVRTLNRVIGQGVDTSGNPLGLFSIKNGVGGNGCDFGYGQIAASLTYNSGSGTLAVGMADWCGVGYLHELDAIGQPIANQFHQISGLPTQNNQPTIAARPNASQFLVVHNYNHVAPRSRVYQANTGGPGPGPGPNPNPGPTPVTIDLSTEGAPNGSWFLAEGLADATPFNTFYLVSNEHANPVRVRAYFANSAGTVKTRTFDVAAKSRSSIDLNVAAGQGSYAAVFQSLTPGQDIYVERSVYFGPNFEGSTVGTTTKTLGQAWHFAEGSRGGELFANYFLLFNPDDTAISVTGTFYPSHGGPVQRTFEVGAQSRLTVNAAEINELAGKDFSTTFTSNGGFVAERAMYWGNPWHGGTVSMGAPALQSRWLFAEGVANSILETFYLILNPNDFPIEVTGHYFPEYSNAFSRTISIPARSRFTVYLNGTFGEIGPAAAEFTSQANFLAERSVYWGGRVEGSNVIGVNAPAFVWSLPEGSDSSLFDTYTLIANPNFHAVELDVTFFFDDGVQVTIPENLRPVVPARGRLTLDMSGWWLPLLQQREGRQLVGKSFSTRISVYQQTGPVIVEHAVYWNLQPGILWRSGGASVGIPH